MIEITDVTKKMVQEKYSQIADQSTDSNLNSCCGATGCGTDEVYSIMSDDYTQLKGYVAGADLGLGCGIPTLFTTIQPGQTVLDLGSGAGNDAFIAREKVGPSGKVIGIDFTPRMVEKARENADKMGYNNVEFRLGDIEQMPVGGGVADIVLSNCVLNLVPNKQAVFSEIFRVLKPGGQFSISDIVLEGALPSSWRQVAELYAGCVSGAIQQQVYMEIIKQVGFERIQVVKEKKIEIPDSILLQHLSASEVEAFKASRAEIRSITVVASKPLNNPCVPGGGCC
jgi:SAM-dependent methyltransferase